MSTADLNGHAAASEAAPSLESRIDEHVAALEALLSPLRAERDQVKARLDELNAKEKAIIHATAALRPRPAAPAPSKPKPSSPSGHAWAPSEASLRRVFDLYIAEGEPITPTQLAEKTPGISTETVSKAAAVLRERELLRAAAKVRGGGTLYALMPGAEWPSDPRLDETADS